MKFGYKLLGFQGRLRRADYWICMIAIWAGLIVGSGVVSAVQAATIGSARLPNSADGLSGFQIAIVLAVAFADLALMVAFFWSAIAIQVKRAHDRNQSGWMILLNIIPFFNLINFGILDGTQGPNRFGPSPKGLGVDETFS